jgi:CspA family cold shock protein
VPDTPEGVRKIVPKRPRHPSDSTPKTVAKASAEKPARSAPKRANLAILPIKAHGMRAYRQKKRQSRPVPSTSEARAWPRHFATPVVRRPPQTALGESHKGTTMTIGTVKFYNSAKGFGFIAPEGGGKDVFVHATALEAAGMRSLNEGDKVSFDVQPDPKGSKAVNLQSA